MKVIVYYCEDENYSKECFEAKIKHRLLYHKDGSKKEITYDLNPQVFGHSDGRFNVMFLDSDESIQDNSNKYFARLSGFQKFKLIWSYNNYFIQKTENIKWMSGLIIGFLLGLLANWIKCQ
jgi:hypothetical protein